MLAEPKSVAVATPTVSEKMRADWYLLPKACWERYLRGVPGIVLDGNSVRVHRTHLPLLPTYDPLTPGRPDVIPDWVQSSGDGWAARQHQIQGAHYISTRRGSILAWAMRVGKTLVPLMVHKPNSTLCIIAPLNVRRVWLEWCKKVFPSVRPAVIEGTTYNRKKLYGKPIVFMHYDVAAAWQAPNWPDLGTLVVDEAHYLSNCRSWRTQAVSLIASAAKKVVLLTGTPLWNHPVGLYNLLTIANGKSAWGTFTEYAVRYAAATRGEFGLEADGVSNEEELRERLSEVMHILYREDVAKDLPAITRTVEAVKLGKKETLELAKLVEVLRGHSLHTRTVIGEVARMRRILGLAKVKAAAECADKFSKANERVVVWVWHKMVATEIERALSSPLTFVLTGDVPQKDRDRILDKWRATPAAILIVSLAVAQVGIDLSASSAAIFAEQDWTPSVIAQAESRTFSFARPMNATYVVTDHVVDVKIVNALLSKCSLAEQVGVPAADTEIELLEEALNPKKDEVDSLANLLEYDPICD